MAFISPLMPAGFSKGIHLRSETKKQHRLGKRIFNQPTCNLNDGISRRDLGKRLLSIGLAFGVVGNADLSGLSKEAKAISGLKIFPLTEQLANNYFLMRAGESKADARGEAKSNPIDMISIRERGLTRQGIDEIIAAANALKSNDIDFDAWLWPAIATNSMETAEVLAYELNIRRERVVPEYSYLDARGLGMLDGLPINEVNAKLKDMDSISTAMKPEPNTDGTPNESVEQVFIKLRQLLSKLESQYFGENIIIIAPDSQPLSILQSVLLDHDLEKHHDYAFLPAEIRRIEGKTVSPLDGTTTREGTVELIHKTNRRI